MQAVTLLFWVEYPAIHQSYGTIAILTSCNRHILSVHAELYIMERQMTLYCIPLAACIQASSSIERERVSLKERAVSLFSLAYSQSCLASYIRSALALAFRYDHIRTGRLYVRQFAHVACCNSPAQTPICGKALRVCTLKNQSVEIFSSLYAQEFFGYFRHIVDSGNEKAHLM